MDLDALLTHFFGTDDLDPLDDDVIAAGEGKVRIAFATEMEPGRRFALWTILHALGDAPAPAAAFKDAGLRRAAEDYDRATRLFDQD